MVRGNNSLKPAITEIEQQRLEWTRMQQEQFSKALEQTTHTKTPLRCPCRPWINFENEC
ncbi:MAG: hypothetical protein ACF8AM_07385 [Rhodopirellula sp. JB055]|uniref:hypothetical protein n=1 Tax=Rhodopirellula sp. JB055 TaxID=3342846 RepID=UPI00370B452A